MTNPFECTDSCRYTNRANNQILNIPNFCSFGYYPQVKKYCQHGSESLTYRRYREAKTKMLDQSCHISKKFNCNNKISNIDYINILNLHNSWKGKYQESDICQIEFYSAASNLKLNFLFFISTLFIFV